MWKIKLSVPSIYTVKKDVNKISLEDGPKTWRKTLNRSLGSSHTDKTGQDKTSRLRSSYRCGTPTKRLSTRER